MTRRILAWTSLFVAAGGMYVAAQSSRVTPPPTCALTGSGEFSTGWVQERDGAHYRCVPVLDANLKLVGSAWVSVDARGNLLR